MARVWAALSGGVDSAVAASLLVEQGHEVTGVTLRLRAGDADDAAVSASVSACETLGIPHVLTDATELFQASVVGAYLSEYAWGRTPNPCVVCNDTVKFGLLLKRALAEGADALATGHYARVVSGPHGRPMLARGVDRRRDQSYFLYRLGPDRLGSVLFPVGGMTKDEVRARARNAGLHAAERPASQDACFLPEGGRAALLAYAHPAAVTEGDIVDTRGDVVGRHRGIARYTVGQRKGVGAPDEPARFVLAIDAATNAVVVGGIEDLERTVIDASDAVWWGSDDEREVRAQPRYRSEPVDCTVSMDGRRLEIRFAEPVRAVAPGQAVVCYASDTVLGGGTVSCSR